MPLLDLANELLLQIINSLLHDQTHPTYNAGTPTSFTRIFPLSRTCKRLNAVCGSRLFRQYHISLHNAMLGEIQHYLEAGSVAHALSKADHIQELIVSHGDHQGHQDYNEMTLDALTSLLDAAPRLVSVTLKSDVRQLSAEFWKCLLSKPLRHVEVQGWESACGPIHCLKPLVLDKFALCYHQRTRHLLDVVRTVNLSLKYADVDPGFDLPFRPDDELLRNIHVEVTPPNMVSSAFLDFGEVPQARIHVDMILQPQSSFEVQPKLKEIRKLLPLMFTDDLSGLNVYLKFDKAFTVSRPSLASYPNWHPMFQDHLNDNERDTTDLYAYWENKITQ